MQAAEGTADEFCITLTAAIAGALRQRSLSMVIGRERMRRPVAWWTPLAIAAAIPARPISPTPLTPMGLPGSGSPTNTTSMSGDPAGDVHRRRATAE
jgi:hypothetical protein